MSVLEQRQDEVSRVVEAVEDGSEVVDIVNIVKSQRDLLVSLDGMGMV